MITPEHPPNDTDPEQVIHRFLELIQRQEFDQLAALYAPDAVVSHPLDHSPPLHGADALRQHFSWLAGLGLRMRVTDLRLHRITDPEVAIAEFDYVGQDGRGQEIHRRNVFVWRVRDGLVVDARDYSVDLIARTAPATTPR